MVRSLPLVELLSDQLEGCRVLSVRRGSLTLGVNGEDLGFGSGQVVVKSYNPVAYGMFLKNNSEYLRKKPSLESEAYSVNPEYYRPSGTYQWRKAQHIYEAVQQLPPGERFLPRLLACDETSHSLVLEYVPAQDFRSYYLSGNDKKRKTRELVDHLVELHGIMGKNFRVLYDHVKWQLNVPDGTLTYGLRPRMWKDECNRLRNYLRTIVYEGSEQFWEYLQRRESQNYIASSSDETTQVNNLISRFLGERGIHLENFLASFLRRDLALVYGNDFPGKKRLKTDSNVLHDRYRRGRLALIHGDFNPQNIFNLSMSEQKVTVCDPDEMRIAHRHIDVATALYNIYNMPHTPEQEAYCLELVKRYVEGVKEREKVFLNSGEFITATLETRLKEAIHLFAVDCRFDPAEIRAFTDGDERFNDVPDSDLKVTFLREMFVENLEGFTDYYLSAYGRGLCDLPNAPLLREQILSVEEFFHKSGIVEGSSRALSRGARIRKGLAQVLQE